MAEPWTPPAKPDPYTILNEARNDRQEQRYEIALAKHLWFHENALKYQPSLMGVRLSFAIADWDNLGQHYAPAKMALEHILQDARQRTLQSMGDEVFDPLIEISGINAILGRELETKELFHEIEAQSDSVKTKSALLIVRRLLAKLGDFDTLGRHINPGEDFEFSFDKFDSCSEMVRNGQLPVEMKYQAEKSFKMETISMVEVLVRNGRFDEARQIVEKSKAAWDNEDFHAALKKALIGDNYTGE